MECEILSEEKVKPHIHNFHHYVRKHVMTYAYHVNMEVFFIINYNYLLFIHNLIYRYNI